VRISSEVADEIAELAFDPQTSGGLLLALPESQAIALLGDLQTAGNLDAAIIGTVLPAGEYPIELA